ARKRNRRRGGRESVDDLGFLGTAWSGTGARQGRRDGALQATVGRCRIGRAAGARGRPAGSGGGRETGPPGARCGAVRSRAPRSARSVRMDVVWGAESGAVRWVQGWGSWLEPFMQAVTALGAQALFIALLPLLFWSVHAGLGARLSLALLGSATVNAVVKALLYAPRPYWYDPGIRPLATESTFGAPSGHAQLSTTFWGYLAAQSARRAVWAGAAVLVALICLSRLYLGVHFFTDIALGLALGALLLWLARRYEDALLRRWRALSLPVQLLLAAVLSTGPVAPVAAYQAVLRAGWSVPEEWAGAVPPDVAGEALAHPAALGGGLLGGVAG